MLTLPEMASACSGPTPDFRGELNSSVVKWLIKGLTDRSRLRRVLLGVFREKFGGRIEYFSGGVA